MHVDDQQILSASKELWTAHLGLTILPQADGAGGVQEKTRSSCVKISGTWQGAILIECPESIVRHAAAMLFAVDSDETSEDDIEDAAKELADLFGKKMRPFLPDEIKISRPSIVDDETSCKALSGMQGFSELKLSCEGRPVRIALFQAQPDLAATG
jgi:hypothetical protein